MAGDIFLLKSIPNLTFCVLAAKLHCAEKTIIKSGIDRGSAHARDGKICNYKVLCANFVGVYNS